MIAIVVASWYPTLDTTPTVPAGGMAWDVIEP
jgi:hypothetical protein